MNARNRSVPSRRLFLKGLGVCVALPALESLMPTANALAAQAPAAAGGAPGLATTATGAPLRTAFVYFPNGAIPASWWPSGGGASFEFGQTLKPLEQHKKVLQVLKGLDHKTAVGGADGGGDHARANGTFLTGVRLKKSATVLEAGPSIDQVIANRIGHLTRLPSLELSADYVRKSGACDSGYSCAYQYNLAWSSSTTPVSAEFNPRRAFERLFGDGPHGERTSNMRRRQAEQRSILDFVLDDARAMTARSGARDRDKLDQYFTAVREIEQRVERAERFGQQAADPDVPTPLGVPATYEEHVQLMFDMLLLAFQTDSTRVATFLLAHDGSNRSFSDIGVSGGHHDLSHHQNKADVIKKVEQIDLWYVKQFARFLEKAQAIKDVDGNTLLHNSQIVYGSGNADGNKHTHTDLPILLAGNGGGTMTPGRYVQLNSTPTTNLFLNMARRLGIDDLQRFGDSTGPLAGV